MALVLLDFFKSCNHDDGDDNHDDGHDGDPLSFTTAYIRFSFPFLFSRRILFLFPENETKKRKWGIAAVLLLLLDLLDENDEFGKAEARGSSPANGIGVRSLVGAGLEIGVGWSIR
ncbi:tyrosine-sulfated glycopeptide receptor 1 [Pyrus ussuriensis x Pyrus communis]|uniref:Tyrosine-sulfated glycopeptide receptor 1 n=1 Tax=Pyrus ussuriensis x Pyrus communis TaxID=2448454 RepID=A0A5N5GQY8_9ROSA|nr:tyrosine-sulfated glycopeptide receptor 1 [Pyrus ussuriensis x Pyrus communis]